MRTLILFILFGSLNASATSFLGALDLTQGVFTPDELQSQIKLHAGLKRNYLSLGETHLEAESAFPILLELAKIYHSAGSTPYKGSACVEVNTGMHRSGMSWLESHYETQVRTENSPLFTDFKDCFDSRAKSQIIYSGLFHQFPWTRSFGAFFDSSKVQSEDKNNIREQLKPGNGLFVSEIELPYLISLEVRELLKSVDSVSAFQKATENLKKQVADLHSKMVVLNESESKWHKKYGIIISQKTFKDSSVLPKNAYLIITDLAYRMEQSPVLFLDEINKLSLGAQTELLKLMRTERMVYQQTLLTPTEDGVPATTMIGAYPIRFEGEASIFWISTQKQTILIANSNSIANTGLQCFTVQKQAGSEVKTVQCEELLLELSTTP